MSSRAETSPNGAKPYLRNSTRKGLVSSFGFTMPPEIKKRMRPMSASFGMLDNYDQKTTPSSEERSPETPMINTLFSNNQLVTKLIPPTTQIPLKKDLKRKSQPEFAIKETYNYNRNGSKIASIKRASVQYSRPEVNYSSSTSHYTNTKQTNNNKQVNKPFSDRLKSESDSYSNHYEKEYTVNRERSIRKNTVVFDDDDIECSEYGYGEALAVEECTEINDKLDVIDNAFDNIGMSVPLRDVLINLDDSTFESLAAMSTSVRIEDEKFPIDEFFNLTDSEPEPDEPACCKIELPMIRTELMSPCSPMPDYFEDDYFDQPGLTFNMAHSQSLDEEQNESIGSLDSGDYIFQPGNYSSENVSVENVVIDEDYNSNLIMNSISYNHMYNIANQDILSETSESADMHDDA